MRCAILVPAFNFYQYIVSVLIYIKRYLKFDARRVFIIGIEAELISFFIKVVPVINAFNREFHSYVLYLKAFRVGEKVAYLKVKLHSISWSGILAYPGVVVNVLVRASANLYIKVSDPQP